MDKERHLTDQDQVPSSLAAADAQREPFTFTGGLFGVYSRHVNARNDETW